jgi:DNA-binding transcriptional MerR regulator
MERLVPRAAATYTVCTVISVDLYISGLSIGELAQRTGIGVSTLRAWERRHGFPVPQRMPSGHRRYRERDVDALREVRRERGLGSTLEAALTRARERAAAPRSSVFATVRDALVDVTPVALTKRGMHALSRAIEDEGAARGEGGVFIGAFQASRFWRAALPRWRDLATRADVAVALAGGRRVSQRANLCEVPIGASSPIAQEWAVICDSPAFAACLVGVERPGQDGTPDAARAFEALWSVEPAVVRAAATTASGLVAERSPAIAERLAERLRQPAVATYDTIRSATAVTNRMLAYVGVAAPP